MAKLLAVLFAAVALQTSAADNVASSNGETVVVLHGLARSSASMSHMVRALEKAGYHVCNIAYPSREHSIEVLTTQFVAPAVRTCLSNKTDQAHFVTHSMGGVIVRQLARSATDLKIGRVVMLSPPNHGSEVVDKLGELSLFRAINGPELEGMTGFCVMPASHPFIMKNKSVIEQTLAFLAKGRFTCHIQETV